jgi:hypothetical protein
LKHVQTCGLGMRAPCTTAWQNAIYAKSPGKSPPGIGIALRPVRIRFRIPSEWETSLNLRQLVEIATLISAHSPNLIKSTGRLPEDALQRYFSCSHARARAWMTIIDAYPRAVQKASNEHRQRVWDATEPMIVDVLSTELITRLWGAVLIAKDRAAGRFDAEPVARDALLVHLDARHKVLRLLVDGPFVTLEQTARLDRLRRRIERWTDLLLGHILRKQPLGDFAFDFERSLDFGEEQLRDGPGSQIQTVWELYLLCLRTGFPALPLPEGFAGALRLEIMRSILACFPGEMFHDEGPMKTARVGRLLTDAGLEGPPPKQTRPRSAVPTHHRIR